MIWVLLGSKGTLQAVPALNLVLFSYRKIVPAGIHRRSYANGQYKDCRYETCFCRYGTQSKFSTTLLFAGTWADKYRYSRALLVLEYLVPEY